jgi:peroxiredoxin 2/4
MKICQGILLLLCVFFTSLGFSKEPKLGEMAPVFRVSTARGEISFPEDFLGQWTFLFSVPNIQTTLCTLELMKCLKMTEEWKSLDTQCLLLTCHESANQQQWVETTLEKLSKEGVKIQGEDLLLMIPDPEKKIAHLYGMIQPAITKEKPIRAVYLIDPLGKIRYISLYPMKNARSFEEIARLIAAMQKTDENSAFVTSPDWEKGEAPILCEPCSQLKK